MVTSLPPYIREAVREAAKTCVRAETSPPLWDATVSTGETSISLPGPVYGYQLIPDIRSVSTENPSSQSVPGNPGA